MLTHTAEKYHKMVEVDMTDLLKNYKGGRDGNIN